MKRVLFILIIINIFNFSCKEVKNKIEIPNVETVLFHQEINLQEGILGRVTGIVKKDSLLIIKDDLGDCYFTVLNLNSGKKIFSFGMKGKGPGELYLPMFMDYNDMTERLEITALQPRGILSYNIDSLMLLQKDYNPNLLKVASDGNRILSVNRLNDTLFIGKGGMSEGQFALINSTGDIISIQEKYVVRDEYRAIGQDLIGLGYQGEISVHPIELKFVYISLTGSVFEICELDSNMVIHKNITYYNELPKFKSFIPNVVQDKENIIGYMVVKATSKFIYTLYSESDLPTYYKKPYANTILVFDWDGNLVQKYVTDIGIEFFTVTIDDSAIYATAANPEPIIVKFVL